MNAITPSKDKTNGKDWKGARSPPPAIPLTWQANNSGLGSIAVHHAIGRLIEHVKKSLD